ncbi:MAG TPA: hemerythrin domain-containing protein [Terracidiphilus sp.]|jgi:hemerythrin-like domain-containing protein
MSPNLIKPPRRLILQSGLAAASVALATQGNAGKAAGPKVADVTPPEDLMREHGVLDRVLLIYEAAMRKFAANADFNPKVISDSAKVVQDFIENYHEKSEENFIFPRFRKSGQLIDLVETLLQQHQAGRRVTQAILRHAPASRQDGDARRQTIASMQSFIAMYRPHAAREDTVLFPKLRSIVSAHEFDAIGEDMEKQEHQHFGEDGFEKAAAHVSRLEKAVGIDDLRQFTPPG